MSKSQETKQKKLQPKWAYVDGPWDSTDLLTSTLFRYMFHHLDRTKCEICT